MAAKPLAVPLPADLPEDWTEGQIVAPQGADAGLSEQHGYNYLMAAVNAAQRAVNTLNEAASMVSSTLVTLPRKSWAGKRLTVAVAGVSKDEAAQLITPVPAAASQSAYYDAGIKLTAQAAGSLTFAADTVPASDLSVYVVVQEVA